jgi:hypothetical protein
MLRVRNRDAEPSRMASAGDEPPAEEKTMRKCQSRRASPVAAIALFLLLLAGALAACAVPVTPLPPHMDQHGAV